MNEKRADEIKWATYDTDLWDRARKASIFKPDAVFTQKPRYPRLPNWITRLFRLYDRYNIFGKKL